MRLEWVLQFLKIDQMRVRSETYRRGSFDLFLEFVKTRNEAEECNKLFKHTYFKGWLIFYFASYQLVASDTSTSNGTLSEIALSIDFFSKSFAFSLSSILASKISSSCT